VCAIIDDTSKELDNNNNPIINSENVRRGANNHTAKGETTKIVVARVKVQLKTVEWDTIKVAVNNGVAIPVNARREVLLGYHYTLHRQAQ
jgi:hypothetical protein